MVFSGSRSQVKFPPPTGQSYRGRVFRREVLLRLMILRIKSRPRSDKLVGPKEQLGPAAAIKDRQGFHPPPREQKVRDPSIRYGTTTTSSLN